MRIILILTFKLFRAPSEALLAENENVKIIFENAESFLEFNKKIEICYYIIIFKVWKN